MPHIIARLRRKPAPVLAKTIRRHTGGQSGNGRAPSLMPPRELPQHFTPLFERPLFGSVRNAEMRVARAEYAAGNHQQILANRLGDELGSGSPGSLEEQVKRSCSAVAFEIVL